jgi:hypothetical protein
MSNHPMGVTDNDPHFDMPSVGDDEKPERWIFTFGFGHTHPATGERLANCYVEIEGDVNESRDIMEHHFGLKWAFQYPTEEKAGVEKYGLQRIEL